jgi:hypothetical protein
MAPLSSPPTNIPNLALTPFETIISLYFVERSKAVLDLPKIGFKILLEIIAIYFSFDNKNCYQ